MRECQGSLVVSWSVGLVISRPVCLAMSRSGVQECQGLWGLHKNSVSVCLECQCLWV